MTRCLRCGRSFPDDVAWLHVWRAHLSPTVALPGDTQIPAIETAAVEGRTAPGPAVVSTLDPGVTASTLRRLGPPATTTPENERTHT